MIALLSLVCTDENSGVGCEVVRRGGRDWWIGEFKNADDEGKQRADNGSSMIAPFMMR